MYNKKLAKLILANGKVFNGFAFGYIGQSVGEICFNTGMTGYQEILTDPSYCNQLITMTNPHIGNYGINYKDEESKKIYAKGFIIKEGSIIVSNHRSKGTLENYLINNKIVGIQGLDTRSIVRLIREEGAMNGIISSSSLNDKKIISRLKKQPLMVGQDLAKIVTCDEIYHLENSKSKHNILVIDYGVKQNILNLLLEQNFKLTIAPANITINEIIKINPDGVFLSNGPGDPAAVYYAIKTVKDLLAINMPIFGICLGHQILALALGAKTYKLKFGHRGCNHPVKHIEENKVEITSQNHGFAVDTNSIPRSISITHTSLNDNTIEGLKCNNKPAFSVQYHPESSPGPHDSRYLFKKFKKLIIKNKKKHLYAQEK